MFGEFLQQTKKSEDCREDCSNKKYLLQARHVTTKLASYYQIEGNNIITKMKHFYLNLEIT